jgi:hypothetical protein
MKLPPNTPILHLDSPTFAEDLAAALGIQPGEKIQIATPQFERTDGQQVPAPMFSPSDWARLPAMDDATLKELGLGVWDRTDAGTHWLFPKEWYGIVPAGLMVTFIGGEVEPFEPGVTDDDYRFGCLAFGFIKPAKVPA